MPALSYSGMFGPIGQEVTGPDRQPLTGSVAQICDDIGQLHEVGVTSIVFQLGARALPTSEVLSHLQIIGREVLPRFA